MPSGDCRSCLLRGSARRSRWVQQRRRPPTTPLHARINDVKKETAQTAHPLASTTGELDAFLSVKAVKKKLDRARLRVAASLRETVRQQMKADVLEVQRVHNHKAKLALAMRQRQNPLCRCARKVLMKPNTKSCNAGAVTLRRAPYDPRSLWSIFSLWTRVHGHRGTNARLSRFCGLKHSYFVHF